MIIYMNIPSSHAMQKIRQLPHGKMIVGYVCDDCVTEKTLEQVNIQETTLRNLWAVEKNERWDSDSGCFVTGMHLCRPHAIKRRWRTNDYRKNVLDGLLPVVTSDKHRRSLSSTGEYLYKKERMVERWMRLKAQILLDWENERLDLISMRQEDLQFWAGRAKIKARIVRFGSYIYRPEFEQWLSDELSIPLAVVHRKLLRQWLDRRTSYRLGKDYYVVVNGIVRGYYLRYHGFVISDDCSINFSSSLELSFIIECILDGKSVCNITNSRSFAVAYKHTGKHRIYYPDFLVDSSMIAEIKDSRERDKTINVAKAKSCEAFCLDRNLSYKMVTELDIGKEYSEMADAIVSVWLDEREGKYADKTIMG